MQNEKLIVWLKANDLDLWRKKVKLAVAHKKAEAAIGEKIKRVDFNAARLKTCRFFKVYTRRSVLQNDGLSPKGWDKLKNEIGVLKALFDQYGLTIFDVAAITGKHPNILRGLPSRLHFWKE